MRHVSSTYAAHCSSFYVTEPTQLWNPPSVQPTACSIQVLTQWEMSDSISTTFFVGYTFFGQI